MWVGERFYDFMSGIKLIFLSIPLIWSSFWAIFMIVLVALIGMGIMYMIYVVNPRIPGMNHIFDIDGYVKNTYSPGLIEAIKQIASYPIGNTVTWISCFSGYRDLVASAQALVAGEEGTLEADLKVYLAFRSSIANNNNVVTAADLRTNAPQFVKPDGNTIDTNNFTNTVLNPLNNIASLVGTLSGQIQDLGDLRTYLESIEITDKVAVTNAIKFATAVHQTRMMMEQVSSIEKIFMANRPSKNAIWTLYYLPFIRDVFTVRIPSTWMNWPRDFQNAMFYLHDMWLALGDYVTSFPATVAKMIKPDDPKIPDSVGTMSTLPPASKSPDPVVPRPRRPRRLNSSAPPRRQICESFVGFSGLSEVREGFGLGDLFGLASAVGNLMGSIGTIVTTFGWIVSEFVSNPFMALIQFAVLTLSVLMTIPLTILYFICSALLIDWFFCVVYAFNIATWWCVVYTLFLILTVVLVAIPYFFLWLMDIMTGGMVSRLMRCENSPHGWYADHGFVDRNEYSSEPLSCWGPCAQRYEPTYGGTCCGARSGYMPDFCPQQQIYRIYEKKSVPWDSGPIAFIKYTPQAGFNTMTTNQKKGAIETAYMQKIKWYQKCYDGMNNHDYLTRHICDNVDVLFPYEGAPPQVNVTLSTVCKEIFCDYKPGSSHAWMTGTGYQESAPGGGNLASCDRLVDVAVGNIAASGSPPGTELLRKVLVVSLAVIAIMVSVRSIRTVKD